MVLAAAVLVEALLVEVALLWEGVVSMDLDSLVGPVWVALQVVLQGSPSRLSSIIGIVGIVGVTKRRSMMVVSIVI